MAALSLLEEAVAYFRAARDRFHTSEALLGVAAAHGLLPQPEPGRAAYREALRLSIETMNLPGIGSALLVGSGVESAAGQHPAAVRMLGAALALSQTTGASSPTMPAVKRRVEEAASHAIGGEAAEAALAEGRRMAQADVVEFAKRLAG